MCINLIFENYFLNNLIPDSKMRPTFETFIQSIINPAFFQALGNLPFNAWSSFILISRAR